jgi:hypothetical protein
MRNQEGTPNQPYSCRHNVSIFTASAESIPKKERKKRPRHYYSRSWSTVSGETNRANAPTAGTEAASHQQPGSAPTPTWACRPTLRQWQSYQQARHQREAGMATCATQTYGRSSLGVPPSPPPPQCEPPWCQHFSNQHILLIGTKKNTFCPKVLLSALPLVFYAKLNLTLNDMKWKWQRARDKLVSNSRSYSPLIRWRRLILDVRIRDLIIKN